MRFVPIKNVEQQAVLALHRVRQDFVKAPTAQAKQICGLFIRVWPGHVTRVPELIEDASNELPGSFRLPTQNLLDHLKELDPHHHHRFGGLSEHAKNFDGGRQVAAWLGMVLRQNSSRGKQNLLGMSKRGTPISEPC